VYRDENVRKRSTALRGNYESMNLQLENERRKHYGARIR
jgi:hypothetical protein